MGIAFSVLNAKGGVGKTTSAVNIAAIATTLPKPNGERRKVLVCDVDQQMNATQQLGFGEIEPEDTLARWVTRDAEIDQIILRGVAFLEGLDLLPSHYQLAYVDRGLLETGTWLRRKLQPIRDRYDLIIFDCPVHLGDLTRNALAASNGILVPTQPEKHSVLGLPHLTARAAEIFEETEVRN